MMGKKVRIEGSDLTLILTVDGREHPIPVTDLELVAAPEQPGVVLFGKTRPEGNPMAVYVDHNGEKCDENTVRYIAAKTDGFDA